MNVRGARRRRRAEQGKGFISHLKDNSTMNKTEAQIVSYGILYLNPSSHQCQLTFMQEVYWCFNTSLTDTVYADTGATILGC